MALCCSKLPSVLGLTADSSPVSGIITSGSHLRGDKQCDGHTSWENVLFLEKYKMRVKNISNQWTRDSQITFCSRLFSLCLLSENIDPSATNNAGLICALALALESLMEDISWMTYCSTSSDCHIPNTVRAVCMYPVPHRTVHTAAKQL